MIPRRTPMRRGPGPKRSGPIHRQPVPKSAWRRPKDDQVTQDLVDYLARRDGGCIAPLVDPLAGLCGDRWGYTRDRADSRCWTVEHVHEGYGKAGDRAKSDRWHTCIVCSHHQLDGWATSHKDDERDYLLKKEGPPDGPD